MKTRDIVGFPILVLLLVTAGLKMWVVASPRTPVDKAYRTLAPSDPACAGADRRLMSRRGNKESFSKRAWACYFQTHENLSASYDLAVIEFGEDGRLLLPEQKDELLRRLSGQKTILSVFVHGWRHDARRENRNLEDFRTLLSYSDMYRRQRCGAPGDADQRYCDHRIVGVYVAWRGASIREPASEQNGALNAATEETFSWESIPAYLSFDERKSVSDGPLAQGIGKALREISGQLRAADAGVVDPFQRNRMLISGHSLGANILLNAFGQEMAAEIEAKGRHNIEVGDVREKKIVITPPAGDLIVLFNPAAEASKWTLLQHAVRRVAGVAHDDETNDVSGKVYSARQGPVMVSYTSTCDWGDLVRHSNGKCGTDIDDEKADDRRCDWVTSKVFRLFKQVDTGSWNPEETIAVGHLLGKVAVDTRKGVRVGATHEAEINRGVGSTPGYLNAGAETTAPCTRVDGVYDPSEIERKCRYRWDLSVPFTPYAPDVASPSWQIRRGVWRGCLTSPTATGCAGGNCRHIYPELTPTRDPFWNVRVINDIIASHNTVFHHHLWCGANQFLLDRVIFDLGEPPKPSFPGPGSQCTPAAPPTPQP